MTHPWYAIILFTFVEVLVPPFSCHDSSPGPQQHCTSPQVHPTAPSAPTAARTHTRCSHSGLYSNAQGEVDTDWTKPLHRVCGNTQWPRGTLDCTLQPLRYETPLLQCRPLPLEVCTRHCQLEHLLLGQL